MPANRSTFILVGPVGGGKTTLFKALYRRDEAVRKTQSVEFEEDGSVDSPGEFINIPRMYHAFIQVSSDIDTLVYVHPSDELEFKSPPGLLFVYPDKRHIAVISKTDLAHNNNLDKIEAMLRANGFKDPIFHISTKNPASINALRRFLQHGETKKTKASQAHSKNDTLANGAELH